MDNVKPLKLETSIDGSQNDEFQTEVNSLEDYITAKGFSFENLKTHYIDLKDNEIAFTDIVNGTLKISEIMGGGGLTANSHKALDQLVHNISETCYVEINRTNNKINSVIYWDSISKLKKIREELITYSSNFISEVVTKQYDSSGSLSETLTDTYNRDVNNFVTSITSVLS
jgi:hypothetical protein